jgi:hypothetical protein
VAEKILYLMALGTQLFIEVLDVETIEELPFACYELLAGSDCKIGGTARRFAIITSRAICNVQFQFQTCKF